VEHAINGPRVVAEEGPQLRFVGGFDRKQSDVIADAANRAAHGDDSSFDKLVRERRVLRPRFLLAHRAIVIPVRPFSRRDREDSHAHSFDDGTSPRVR
jgi:hypothetical protein